MPKHPAYFSAPFHMRSRVGLLAVLAGGVACAGPQPRPEPPPVPADAAALVAEASAALKAYADDENADAALVVLARTYAARPDVSALRTGYINLLLRTGRFAAVEEVLRAELDDPTGRRAELPDAQGHALLGSLYLRRGAVRASRATLDEGLRRFPNDPGILSRLAHTLHATGLMREAEGALVAALEADPRHLDAHGTLGTLLSLAGRCIDAEPHLREALAASPQVEWMLLLAGCAYEQGDYPSAARFYLFGLGMRPDHPRRAVVLYNAACALARAGEEGMGLAVLEEGLRAGFAEAKALRDDPDIAALRGRPAFRSLLRRYGLDPAD